jgi:His/Glu/Gln/Arg/opine family amino acid ABC transporter permease subunit
VAVRRRRALHAITLLGTAHLDFTIVRDAAPALAHGALVTFEITAAGMAGSLAVGVTAAGLRMANSRAVRAAATAFAEFFRNTPPLVHIFFAYFALPAIGINVPGFVAATVALVLYQGAIASEILRAGLEAVPAGQIEAADALGLGGFERFRSVVAPQALRISLPALGNNLISLFKNTSLVSAIGVLDVTGVAQDVIAQRLSSAELYLTIGAFYLLCVFAFAGVLRALEARLARYGT